MALTPCRRLVLVLIFAAALPQPHRAPRVALGAALDRLVVRVRLLLAQVGKQPMVRLGRHLEHRIIPEALDEPLHDVTYLGLEVRMLIRAPEEQRRHEARQQRTGRVGRQRHESDLAVRDRRLGHLLGRVGEQAEDRREELREGQLERRPRSHLKCEAAECRERRGHHVRRVAREPSGYHDEEGADRVRFGGDAPDGTPFGRAREGHEELEGGGTRLDVKFFAGEHHLAEQRGQQLVERGRRQRARDRLQAGEALPLGTGQARRQRLVERRLERGQLGRGVGRVVLAQPSEHLWGEGCARRREHLHTG